MNKNYNNNNYSNTSKKVHHKCYKCYYNGHIASACPFKDKRYQFEVFKMYLSDLMDSQWTIKQVNQYYLQKVFIEFPTVDSIREYLHKKGQTNKFGRVKKPLGTTDAKVPSSKDGSSGFEFLRIFAKMIDEETAQKNAELERKLKEEQELRKNFPSIVDPGELSIAKAVSGSFKESLPDDTRKAKPSKQKIYTESDFLTEEGYRNYLINDDVSQLIPEKIRNEVKGMRGVPGVVRINEYAHPGSEYKETVKIGKEQREAEEHAKNPGTSTKNLNVSKPVASSNSPFTMQIRRELDRLNEMLDEQEKELSTLQAEFDDMDYDDSRYDELDRQIITKKRKYQETLNKYNVLVNKFS